MAFFFVGPPRAVRPGLGAMAGQKVPEALQTALDTEGAEASAALAERLRELDAATPQAVANTWDSAEEFAEEFQTFREAARSFWEAMDRLCAEEVSIAASLLEPGGLACDA